MTRQQTLTSIPAPVASRRLRTQIRDRIHNVRLGGGVLVRGGSYGGFMVDAGFAIAQVLTYPAWALIRRSTRAGDKQTIGVVGGVPWIAAALGDIPLETGAPASGHTVDRLVAVPFRQITERGFAVHDDGTPLTVMDIKVEFELSVAEAIAALPAVPITFADSGGFETTDAEYEKIVAAIICDEIGQGEGANLVIGRTFRAVIADWSAEKALSVYRRLLEHEHGAYWTFIYYTGERYLIGASPERHLSISNGAVRMNPISGTFRLPAASTSFTQSVSPEQIAAQLKPQLMEFLRDEKEIYELFMVVDEELKMMCDICSSGGQVLGPFLKPMARLIHTEYLLAGHTDRDPREVLRETMFAATVTGSPVENAVRLIKKYEPRGRGYYGAALALFGRDSMGEPTVDSPIVIRTADVALDGTMTVTAGATLVRDSVPVSEVAETRAKASGILAAFGVGVAAAPPSAVGIAELVTDDDVLLELNNRNRRLSTFWLSDQAGEGESSDLAGKTAVILDGGDDFAKMIRHILNMLGMETTLVRFADYVPGCLSGYDLVVTGPGPGDPRSKTDPKIVQLRAVTRDLLAARQPFLAVCLGHQVLANVLGLPLGYKDIVFQGTQAPITLSIDDMPHRERVGFYNTFVARNPSLRNAVNLTDNNAPLQFDTDPDTGDINAIYGPHYTGIQFHAESILTEHGFQILHQIVSRLLSA